MKAHAAAGCRGFYVLADALADLVKAEILNSFEAPESSADSQSVISNPEIAKAFARRELRRNSCASPTQRGR